MHGNFSSTPSIQPMQSRQTLPSQELHSNGFIPISKITESVSQPSAAACRRHSRAGTKGRVGFFPVHSLTVEADPDTAAQKHSRDIKGPIGHSKEEQKTKQTGAPDMLPPFITINAAPCPPTKKRNTMHFFLSLPLPAQTCAAESCSSTAIKILTPS